MKYIDADKLIAEIRIIQQSLEHRDVRFNQVKKIRTESMIELCKCIFDVIDSLQQEQPEVDLEEEITRFFNQLAIDESLQDGVSISKFDLVRTARHFAEWGAIHLNARKEDEK